MNEKFESINDKNLIKSLYLSIFGRNANSDELKNDSLIISGMTREAALEFMIPKFINMVNRNEFIDDANLIEALYLSILGRKSDVDGSEYNMSLISGMTRKAALEFMIPQFIKSNEFSENYFIKFFNYYLAFINKAVKRKKVINHFIGLGTHCYTSQLLKNAGLKKYSCPFDWLFSSTSMNSHMIDDDFKIFLDNSHYKPIPIHLRMHGEGVNRVDHEYYLSNFGAKFVFNHHDVHFQKDFDYFVRAVNRFRSVLSSGDNVMFVVCTRHNPNVLSEFKKLTSSLLKSQKNGTQINLRYFSIEDGNNPLPESKLLNNELEGFELFHFKSCSEWGALSFEDQFDDLALLKMITNEVEFDLKAA